MPSLAPVTDAHRFDETALAAHLKAAGLDGFDGPVSVLQFQGGQSNPTFLIEAGSRKYVLRKKPPGDLLPSAHQIEREYKAMTALAKIDVPVPDCLLLEENSEIIGTAFYVMNHLDGRIFDDYDMAGLDAEDRAAAYRSMGDTLAALHRVDPAAIELGDFGWPEGYIDRQIARWSKQYRASETVPIPEMDNLISWLPEHRPAAEQGGDETGIAHGDFRVGNLMLHPTEPRVIAVLDWELATLGHPLADLAYNVMPWRLPADLKALRGLVGLDLTTLGIPGEDAYVARYCDATGRDGIPDWPFYLAFALFRLAAICQGVKARALSGNASSENAHDIGDLAPILAKTGWETTGG
ncbi:MAG: phosphotransferase [Alphaproteobacteria bacterium]|nr:phosphotransferase [Alphaproteobacteria bacterium]